MANSEPRLPEALPPPLVAPHPVQVGLDSVSLCSSQEAYQRWFAMKMKNNELVCTAEHLLNKVEKLKRKLSEQENLNKEGKPKRFRRTADKIDRKYVCPNCEKAYGTEASLVQHQRLKHADSDKDGYGR